MPFSLQVIHLLSALMLLLAFAMLTERRVLQLTRLYALQGLLLCLMSALIAHDVHQTELYGSALLTLFTKVLLIPHLLKRLMLKLRVRWDTEMLVNIPTTLLMGLGLVIIAFYLARPLMPLTLGVAGQGLGIALACVLLSLLMMIVRTRALSQVVGFLAMENALMFAAIVTANGMPMVVELGMALDVLMGLSILGVFLFQIREQFESLDIRHLETLKEKQR